MSKGIHTLLNPNPALEEYIRLKQLEWSRWLIADAKKNLKKKP